MSACASPAAVVAAVAVVAGDAAAVVAGGAVAAEAHAAGEIAVAAVSATLPCVLAEENRSGVREARLPTDVAALLRETVSEEHFVVK